MGVNLKVAEWTVSATVWKLEFLKFLKPGNLLHQQYLQATRAHLQVARGCSSQLLAPRNPTTFLAARAPGDLYFVDVTPLVSTNGMKASHIAHLEALYTAAVEADRVGDDDLLHNLLTMYAVLSLHYRALSNSSFRARLRRADLHSPRSAAWSIIKHSSGDEGFIRFLGFDIDTFAMLAVSMENALSRPVVHKGRPFSLGADDLLALVLRHIATRMTQAELQLEFGATAAVVSRSLQVGLRALYFFVLPEVTDAEIRWPNPGTIAVYSRAICARSAASSTTFPVCIHGWRLNGNPTTSRVNGSRDLLQWMASRL